MEIASAGWIPGDMVIDSLHDGDLDFDSFHSEDFLSYPYQHTSSDFHIPQSQLRSSSPYDQETPENQLKSRASTAPRGSPPLSSSSPQIISFGKIASCSSSSRSEHKYIIPKNESYEYDFSYLHSQEKKNCYGIAPKYSQLYNANEAGANYGKSSSRTPFYAQEHVITERKRRERLNQRIIALSAIIPGLGKMDKASVLEGATNYLKQLQERVKTLEQQVAKSNGEVVVKKSWLHVDEEISSSCDENSYNESNNNLPEIEARVSGKFVLLKVQCLNRKGCLYKILEEVEKLKLRVLNTGVLPFGSCILDITIQAQMDEEFNMKFEDFIKNLRRRLQGII